MINLICEFISAIIFVYNNNNNNNNTNNSIFDIEQDVDVHIIVLCYLIVFMGLSLDKGMLG